MLITCPECRFSREVAADKIPAGSVKATCPHCGAKFQFRAPRGGEDGPGPDVAEQAVAEPLEHDGAAPEPEAAQDAPQGKPSEIWQRLDDLGKSRPGRPPERGSYSFADAPEPRPTVAPPFEDPDNFGFFDGIVETMKRALLHPVLFFGALPLGTGIRRALIFNVLISELGFLATTVWGELGMDPLAAMMPGGPPEPFTFAELMLTLLVLPVFMVAALYAGAGLVHLGLMMVKGANEGFEATLKTNCYAGSAAIVQLVPFVGPVLGPVLQIVVFYIGLKAIHRTSYARVVLSWVALAAVFMVVAFALSFIGASMDRSMTM